MSVLESESFMKVPSAIQTSFGLECGVTDGVRSFSQVTRLNFARLIFDFQCHRKNFSVHQVASRVSWNRLAISQTKEV